MVWKKIPKHKVPRWIKKKYNRIHLKGKTYLYRRNGRIWYRRLRNEWIDKLSWWEYVLITVVATIIATLLIDLLRKFF